MSANTTGTKNSVASVANTRPPDVGGQDNNQVIYDVIGRMFRFGVRINN